MDHNITLQRLCSISTAEFKCSCGLVDKHFYGDKYLKAYKWFKKRTQEHQLEVVLAALGIRFKAEELPADYQRYDY